MADPVLDAWAVIVWLIGSTISLTNQQTIGEITQHICVGATTKKQRGGLWVMSADSWET